MTQQRSNDEIRADLATVSAYRHYNIAEAGHAETERRERTRSDALYRLGFDVAPLLARVSELEQENKRLREIDARQVRDLNQADVRAERAEAQVRAVEALHRPHPEMRELLGEVRPQACARDGESWPCATVRALSGLSLREEQE